MATEKLNKSKGKILSTLIKIDLNLKPVACVLGLQHVESLVYIGFGKNDN